MYGGIWGILCTIEATKIVCILIQSKNVCVCVTQPLLYTHKCYVMSTQTQLLHDDNILHNNNTLHDT